MKKSRFTEEQMAAILREADRGPNARTARTPVTEEECRPAGSNGSSLDYRGD